jgi:hypothetical protein
LLTRILTLDRLDKLLRPLRSAFRNDLCPAYLFEETKKDQIMSDILDWVNNSRPVHEFTPVFLLHGDSRSAATTIAHAVMNKARKDNRLLASYFVSWNGESKQRDAADLIPTIMYQFALFDRSFLHKIADALVVDRDIRHRDASDQIRMLFDRPLNNAAMPLGPPPLIVIDALDTCDRLGDAGIVSGIRSFIECLTRKTSWRIKLFITCRSTRIVQQMIRLPSSQPFYHSFFLHDCYQQGETPFISFQDRGEYGSFASDSTTD